MSGARGTLAAIALFGASAAILVAVLAFAGTTVPAESLEEEKPLAPSDRFACAALAQRYATEVAQLRACAHDDDCAAEARGRFFAGLDGCVRATRVGASLAQADVVARRWLAAGCAHEFTDCGDEPPAAVCRAGVCAERPPKELPPSWVRTDVQGFAFFLPPWLERRAVQGTDSYVAAWEGHGVDLSLDYGMYSNDLSEAHGPPLDHREEEKTTIGGLNAKLVRGRVPAGFRGRAETPYFVGVNFPRVPCAATTCWSPYAGLTFDAWCATREACDDAERVYRSLRVY